MSLTDEEKAVIKCSHDKGDIYADELVTIIDRLSARVEALEGALETIVGEIDIPDADCHCHIAPPCSDCVEYSHLRDLVTIARQALKREVKP